MSDDTPTTVDVRHRYVNDLRNDTGVAWRDPEAEFDRWLTDHDRQMKAEALGELYAELSGWEGYNTRDIGHAFRADSVLDEVQDRIEELGKAVK